MKKGLLSWLHFKSISYFAFLISLVTIYNFIYSKEVIYLLLTIVLLIYFFYTQEKYRKAFIAFWIISALILLLIYLYWNSNTFQQDQVIEEQGRVIKCKTNYIIVKIKNSKFYVQATQNNYVVGMKIKITGNVSEINSTANYYQFDFKDYLMKDYVRYQLKVSNVEQLNNFNIRVVFYKLFKLDNAHALINILFLNKQDSSDLLISNLNNLGLKFLINFNLINILLFFKYIEKMTGKKVSIFLIIILFTWNYLTCWPMIMTRILFKQILNSFEKLKDKKELKNLIVMIWLILLFPNFISSSGFWYINLIILFSSLMNKRVNKIWGFIYFYILLNVLNAYFTYQLNITSSFYAILLSPILSVYYLITPIFYFIDKNLLNNLYDVLLLIISIFNSFSLIRNVGSFNILFLILGFIMSVTLATNLVTIKIKIFWAILFLLTWGLLWLLKPSEYLSMLNVGNGNSFVYHNKWNNITIIFDAGVGKQRSSNLVSDFLKYEGINKIDIVFISHTHEDHYNNLFSLKENFKIKQIILNNDFTNSIKIKNVIINVFINPNANSENNKSLVLIVDVGDVRSVFMGDAEKETENHLMNRIDFLYILNLKKVNILQIGHHGSKTSSSVEFINLINPDIALISGENEGGNKKFPHQETINTLKRLKINYYITNGNNNFFVMFKNLKVVKK
ncbi:MBL fold metallo-hydrolase [Mesoplasma coleopterae]|nr:MBL fold metallo-hydrolase [Mesoplasma coleopterae]